MENVLVNTIYDPSGDVLLVLSKKDDSAPATNPPGKVNKVSQNDEHEELGVDDPQPTQPDASNPQTSQPVKEHECRVSSRNLALASPVFRAMLDGGFQEGVELSRGQLKRVPLPDDNLDAMLLVLAIIHGRTRAIPRKIGKELFVDIAVLIDKYEINECAEVYTDMWFAALWPLRQDSPPHLADGIFLCWVLKKATGFKELTKKAIFESALNFDDNGLPLPQWIASDIEQHRLSYIQAIVDYLRNLLNRYISEQQQCRNDKRCDAMTLGSLIKGLNARNLFPLPEAEALDISIKELVSQLRALELMTLCQKNAYMADQCAPKRGLESNLSQLENRVSGFGFERLDPESYFKFFPINLSTSTYKLYF
ncbi:hypothetical protein CLCR_01237 [Cladophialophora carrionii]|uniref:BTB domain-containing protein n=1 Tax=Cladophialophora carrionii TaxID=86049 RepID=A0A1C1CCZ6_9EURO|nr:hypothetical protein CLCR_01237 [Cladophialophora carrionii]